MSIAWFHPRFAAEYSIYATRAYKRADAFAIGVKERIRRFLQGRRMIRFQNPSYKRAEKRAQLFEKTPDCVLARFYQKNQRYAKAKLIAGAPETI